MPIYWVNGGKVADDYEDFDDGVSRALGQNPAGYGAPGSSTSGTGPLASGSTAASTERRTLYGLSSVFRVAFPILVGNENQAGNVQGGDLRSARRSQRFSTGPNPTGYVLDTAFLSDFARLGSKFSVAGYTVDESGHPDTLHASLSPPANFGGVDILAFRAPAGTALDPDTTW